MLTYAVFGAGMQGRAVAYDLVKYGNAEQVIIIDRLAHLAETAAHQINSLLQTTKCLGLKNEINSSEMDDIVEILENCDACVSCVPFIFNEILTACCVRAKCHFSDLGGNTGIALHQIKEHGYAAKEAGISVIPDCGLAPGAVNIFASLLIKNGANEIKIFCGGIPEEPEKCRLSYKKTFAISGLLNEYNGYATYLRNGKVVNIPALSKKESFPFTFQLFRNEGILELEASPTSGGTSTAPFTFEGDVQTYEYRTLRYQKGNHFDFFRNLKEMGLLNEEVVNKALEENLDAPTVNDRIVLEIHGGKNKIIKFTCVGDENFSAMEKVTGFSVSIIAIMQAKGSINPGAKSVEIAVNPDLFLEEFVRRFDDIDLILS